LVTVGCDLWEKPEFVAVFAVDIVVSQRAAALREEAGERPAVPGELGRVVARVVNGHADAGAAGVVEIVMVVVLGTAVAIAAALVVDVEVVGAAAAAAAPSTPFASPADAAVEVVDNVAGRVASAAGVDPVAAVKAAGESWLAACSSLEPAPVVWEETP
jgi:hypothetical protein